MMLLIAHLSILRVFQSEIIPAILFSRVEPPFAFCTILPFDLHKILLRMMFPYDSNVCPSGITQYYSLLSCLS